MEENRSESRRRIPSSREHWKVFGPAILLTLIGFVVAFQFVEPAPPRRISIATGNEQGAYHAFAQRYSEILARDGITLDLRTTTGSAANLALLQGGDAVDVAFVQGGVGDPAMAPELTALASLYLEPLWVFHRAGVPVERLTALRGKRLAVGEEGSGTRAVALQLLADNGVAGQTATLLAMGGDEAAQALLSGSIDAAFYVSAPQAPVIQTLLTSEGVALMSFARSRAYTRAHRFLSQVTLPEGVVDFGANIPSSDISLLAPAANLVVRDLHPALIVLLLQAAAEVHGAAGLFEDDGEFPSPSYLDFPLHPEARRYFRSGPPLLQRYLPFWAASLIDRLKVMLLPLVTLLIPLLKVVPPVYRWRVRSKIYRWYRELQVAEREAREERSPSHLADHLAALDRIEHEVGQLSVPLSYAEELYHLRLHIAHVRNLARNAG